MINIHSSFDLLLILHSTKKVVRIAKKIKLTLVELQGR